MSSTSAINSLLSSTTTPSSSLDISTILASASGATTPGIDVTAAVAAAIYADRAPERVWAAEQGTLSAQTTALTAMQTAASALGNDMTALNTLSGPLSTRTVTSSSPDIIASASAGTVAGNHTINVINTAQTGAWYSDEAKSPIVAVPATSFTITSGTGTSAVSLPFSTGGTSGVNSLNDLAAAINLQTKTLGVNATVVTDSSGSRLAILSNTSGAAANFSITSTDYTGTAWASADIPTGGSLGTDSITLTTGATSATIPTTAGESYVTLAADINAASARVTVPPLNISASVVTDANGTHLSLVSTDGTTAFKINQPSFGFTQAQPPGEDASLTVDGVPVTSASNTVTGAIPGVTLTLLGPTTSAATLTVASDAAGISTALNQFVSDYNTAVGLVNAQYQFSAATNSEGVLSSDPTVRSLQSALSSALQFVAPPYTSTTTTGTSWNSPDLSTGGSLGASSITLSSGSASQTFPTTVGESYTTLAAAINAQTSTLNITASVVTDATGNHLSLSSANGTTPFSVNQPTPTTAPTLDSIGISIGTDGTLSVNQTTLNAALANNPIDVQNFFQGPSLNGFASKLSTALDSFTNPANGGFTIDLKSIAASNTNLTTETSNLERNYIAYQQTLLTAMYSQAEAALQALPTQMAQLSAELGNNSKSGG